VIEKHRYPKQILCLKNKMMSDTKSGTNNKKERQAYGIGIGFFIINEQYYSQQDRK
jgi:hypothetical protein